MEMERRGQPVQLRKGGQPVTGRNLRIKTKPFRISKHLVYEAFKRVKAIIKVLAESTLRVYLILSKISLITCISFGIVCPQGAINHHPSSG
jgi:hypothetical protein